MSDKSFKVRFMAIEDIDDRLAATSISGFEFTEAERKGRVQTELSQFEL